MISIIICSRKVKSLDLLKLNIEDTIGVVYEVIPVDNSANKYGICEAYNVGASIAQYDKLCFMHEDIFFHTKDWGKTIIQILNSPEAGVVGVAGGVHQPKAPAGWGGAGMYIGMNVIHTSLGKTQHDFINPFGKNLIKAATLDGLWLCCNKSVWEEFRFDSVAFPGFHFYDIDFCTRVATKYVNYITFDILIEHFSHGTFDKVWMQNAISFFIKRKQYLPFGVQPMSRTEKNAINLIATHRFINRAIDMDLSKKDIIFCLKECFKMSPFNRDNFYLLKRVMSID